MNLTNLFGKQIYSIYEGEMVGTVLSANYNKDNTKILSLNIFDDDENEFNLPLGGIKAMGDLIIISNKNKLEQPVAKAKTSPISIIVIDENGKNYGIIVDAKIDNGGIIEYLITSTNAQILPKNLHFRKDFALFSENNVKIANFRPRHKKTNLENIKVSILDFNENKNQTNFVPSKIKYNPDSILGKIAKGDLYGLNNEVIIKTNQVITEKIISDAERHNRLNQLYFIAN